MNNEIKQYKNVYESTLEFDNFLKVKFKNSKTIIDAGCGKGGTLSYYVKKYPHLKIYGVDYRSKNIICYYRARYNSCNSLRFPVGG